MCSLVLPKKSRCGSRSLCSAAAGTMWGLLPVGCKLYLCGMMWLLTDCLALAAVTCLAARRHQKGQHFKRRELQVRSRS